jgi:hypothetical protein
MLLLGILDIFAGLSIFSLLFFSWGPMLVCCTSLYLIAKSLPFIKSFASIVDIIVAVIFIAAILGHSSIITYLGSVWLLQKGIASFF